MLDLGLGERYWTRRHVFPSVSVVIHEYSPGLGHVHEICFEENAVPFPRLTGMIERFSSQEVRPFS